MPETFQQHSIHIPGPGGGRGGGAGAGRRREGGFAAQIDFFLHQNFATKCFYIHDSKPLIKTKIHA